MKLKNVFLIIVSFLGTGSLYAMKKAYTIIEPADYGTVEITSLNDNSYKDFDVRSTSSDEIYEHNVANFDNEEEIFDSYKALKAALNEHKNKLTPSNIALMPSLTDDELQTLQQAVSAKTIATMPALSMNAQEWFMILKPAYTALLTIQNTPKVAKKAAADHYLNTALARIPRKNGHFIELKRKNNNYTELFQ